MSELVKTGKPVQAEQMSNVFVGLQDAVIIEAGAYSRTLHDKLLGLLPTLPRAYYMFEPDPRNANRILASALPDYAELIPRALGDRNHTADFRLSSGQGPADLGRPWDMSSSLLPISANFRWPDIKYEKKDHVVVTVQSLDSFCEERGIGNIDFLWADIEGSEGLMLQGAINSLRFVKWLYLECFDKPMWKGAWTRPQIQSFLGQSWLVHGSCDVSPNVLWENLKWTPKKGNMANASK